jgi:SNF2 family DNA or RNA helicase
VIDLSRCRFPPYRHQALGIELLVERVNVEKQRTYEGCFFLADEMGVGKSLQVICAAQVLFERDLIERVIVIAPAAVRAVWYDPELGELRKHLWDTTPARVVEYHAKSRSWIWPLEKGLPKKHLEWLITNYDFVRPKHRYTALKAYCSPKTLLVLDESSAVKNYRAAQTKACRELRAKCGWVWLLNGTPISNNPLDLYSQGELMNKGILGCTSYFHFRARYALMGGFQQKQIVGWHHIDDLQKRFAPYILRRLKSDVLVDLPPKIPAVALTVPLETKTWGIYKEMRDEMVAWLSESTVGVAAQAVVKALRLAQITSGFLGGLQEETGPPGYLDISRPGDPGPADDGQPGTLFESSTDDLEPEEPEEPFYVTQEVGREKLDLFLTWLEERLADEPNLKMLVWCRFRPELARLVKELSNHERWGPLHIGEIRGGQKRAEREVALRLLDPRTAPRGPAIVAGTPASGSMGLNLTSASSVVYISNDFSLRVRLQADDRVHRPGQVRPVSYFDIIATGPDGQRTIDHTIIKALRDKRSLADLTTSAWVKELTTE